MNSFVEKCLKGLKPNKKNIRENLLNSLMLVANILINNLEVPIMDGSSLPFVEELENSEIEIQEIPRKIISVKKEIFVSNNDSYAKITPNKQFSIDFEIDFESQLVSKQACQLQLINGNYKTDVSSARTFGFEKDVDYLQANGLALGGSLGAAGIITKHEIVLAITGGLFVLEAVSVMVQVISFKLTGKRIFRMAPIHHHFEKKGWAESTVVIRFWIISIILAMIGLATLKLR